MSVSNPHSHRIGTNTGEAEFRKKDNVTEHSAFVSPEQNSEMHNINSPNNSASIHVPLNV